MSHYNYKETEHPMTKDKIWLIEDVCLPLGGLIELVQSFIDKYNFPEYSLSIFDNASGNTIEIDCDINNMPKIVHYIYHSEKGTPLTFIGLNSISESYVVGMSICRGNFKFASYKDENGKLTEI